MPGVLNNAKDTITQISTGRPHCPRKFHLNIWSSHQAPIATGVVCKSEHAFVASGIDRKHKSYFSMAVLVVGSRDRFK